MTPYVSAQHSISWHSNRMPIPLPAAGAPRLSYRGLITPFGDEGPIVFISDDIIYNKYSLFCLSCRLIYYNKYDTAFQVLFLTDLIANYKINILMFNFSVIGGDILREIKKRSSIPVYGIAVIWIIYSLIFPLYKSTHFFILICLSVAVYLILSKLFPGKVEYVEIPPEPVTSGNPEIDELLREGEKAIGEMKRLRKTIPSENVKLKIDEIIDVTDKIFKDLLEDPDDFPQVKRFSNYYLPTTLKLLNSYDRMSGQKISGENISGTMTRIEDILDTTILAYKKQLDALFLNQAIDIETDISVLESMLKREGLTGKDFNV